MKRINFNVLMKLFETDAYSMLIHDDLLIEFKVKKNAKLEEKDIWLSRDQSVGYLPGKKFVILIESEGYMDASSAARKAAASEEYSRHVKALALFSTKLHETILGKLFLQLDKPLVPTRFFDNREKAIAWLKEL